jgi:uncharacterized delta-60 repeat protein
MRPHPLALLLALLAPSVAAPPCRAADGDLDLGFGTGGSFRWAAPDGLRVGAVAEAPDGALVAAGRYQDGGDFLLHWKRFTDATAGTSCVADVSALIVGAEAIAFDAEGRLLLAGGTNFPAGGGVVEVARVLYPSCALDPSFGGDGSVEIPIADRVSSATVRALRVRQVVVPPGTTLDRIVVAGFGNLPHGDPFQSAFLLRLTPAGALDPDFGVGGRVFWPGGPEALVETVGDLTLLPDGRTVAVGSRDGDLWVSRRLADGAADPDFGVAGEVSIGFDRVPNGADWGLAVALDGAGRLVVAGEAWSHEHVPPLGGSDVRLALARLRGDGTLDPGFSGDGRALHALGAPPHRFALGELLVQDDAKPVLVGAFEVATDDEMFAARLDAAGSLDPTFAGDGVATFAIDLGDTLDDQAAALAFQSGRPVLAGTADHAVSVRGVVLRLESALIFADGFDSGGRARWSS